MKNIAARDAHLEKIKEEVASIQRRIDLLMEQQREQEMMAINEANRKKAEILLKAQTEAQELVEKTREEVSKRKEQVLKELEASIKRERQKLDAQVKEIMEDLILKVLKGGPVAKKQII